MGEVVGALVFLLVVVGLGVLVYFLLTEDEREERKKNRITAARGEWRPVKVSEVRHGVPGLMIYVICEWRGRETGRQEVGWVADILPAGRDWQAEFDINWQHGMERAAVLDSTTEK